jgi:hypothetical protein
MYCFYVQHGYDLCFNSPYNFCPKRFLLRLIFRCVGFEVLTAMNMKSTVFWDVTPCSSETDRRFGGAYRLHIHSWRVGQARKQKKLADSGFTSLPLQPWTMSWHAEPLLGSGPLTPEEWCFLRGPLNNNWTAREERCFLCSACWDYITGSSCDYERGLRRQFEE